MADAPPTTRNSPPGSDLDRLSHLHRMSRTAGVGGGAEYSAVNVAAVVALLVGLASALALMSYFFLFLPLVGTILAVVAVKQIVSSNGTQTGLPLAVLALLLSFGLTGFAGMKYVNERVREARDTSALDDLAADFGKKVAAKQFDAAYALTDARFREEVTPQQFQALFEQLSASPNFGALTGVRSNKLFKIDADAGGDARMATGYAFFDTEKVTGDDAIRTDITYRFADGRWHVYAIPKLFAPKTPTAGGTPAAAPAGPAGPPQ